MKPAPSLMLATALLLGTATSGSFAIDLGTIGPTYPISEPNLLDFIAQRLKEK